MTKKNGTDGTDVLRFEAALPHVGHAFTLSGEGEAKLVLVVPASAAEGLTKAMAKGALRDTTFLVEITYPVKG